MAATGSSREASTRWVAPSAARMIQLGGHHVDRDDGMRGHQGAALDDVEPDAAHAEDGHARARRHRGGIDHRAHARHHRAADESRAVQRHRGIDADGAGLMDHGARGVGGHVPVGVDGPAVERHPSSPVGQHAAAGLAPLAEIGAPDHAEVATPAGGRPGQDDVVVQARARSRRGRALPPRPRPRRPARWGRARPASSRRRRGGSYGRRRSRSCARAPRRPAGPRAPRPPR